VHDLAGGVMTRMDEALAYASCGWPVFPAIIVGEERRKQPLTRHGHNDATVDAAIIRSWWSRWPQAVIGAPTGVDFCVLDVDPRHGGDQTLIELGFTELPQTLTVRTGGGGVHLYFLPVPGLRNTAGADGRGVGDGLDWRGEGGWVVVPASGTGYHWLNELPMIAVPEALLPKIGNGVEIVGNAARTEVLDEYGAAALRSAASNIMAARNGSQERTLNDECYGIGRRVGAGRIPAAVAYEVLLAAGLRMPSYDPRRQWQPREVADKVRRGLSQGRARPAPSFEQLEREWRRAEDDSARNFSWEVGR
jgi:hypothetical protein